MVGPTSWLSVLFLSVALSAARAAAGEAAPPEVRVLIEKQLDAFARDDAEGAYALAAPGIKAIFPDSDTFMEMVRNSYAPVYRHRSVEFGDKCASESPANAVSMRASSTSFAAKATPPSGTG